MTLSSVYSLIFEFWHCRPVPLSLVALSTHPRRAFDVVLLRAPPPTVGNWDGMRLNPSLLPPQIHTIPNDAGYRVLCFVLCEELRGQVRRTCAIHSLPC